MRLLPFVIFFLSLLPSFIQSHQLYSATLDATLSQGRSDISSIRCPTSTLFYGGTAFEPKNTLTINTVDAIDDITGEIITSTLTSGHLRQMIVSRIGNTILFWNGRKDFQSDASNIIDIYDCITHNVTSITSPIGRWMATSAVIETKEIQRVYVIGGIASRGDFRENVLSDISMYDAKTKNFTWAVASLSVPRDRISVAVLGSRYLIMCGGQQTRFQGRHYAYDTIDILDTTTNMMIKHNLTLKYPLFSAQVTVDSTGTRAYFVGGLGAIQENYNRNPNNHTHIITYTTINNIPNFTIEYMPLPQPITIPLLTWLNTTHFSIFESQSTHNPRMGDINSTYYIFNTINNNITTYNLPSIQPRWSVATTSFQNNIVIAGGYPEDLLRDQSNHIDIINPATSTVITTYMSVGRHDVGITSQPHGETGTYGYQPEIPTNHILTAGGYWYYDGPQLFDQHPVDDNHIEIISCGIPSYGVTSLRSLGGTCTCINQAYNSMFCNGCTPGTYVRNETDPITNITSTRCASCPAGYYSDIVYTSSCTPCPINTYNPNTHGTSLSACLPCPGAGKNSTKCTYVPPTPTPTSTPKPTPTPTSSSSTGNNIPSPTGSTTSSPTPSQSGTTSKPVDGSTGPTVSPTTPSIPTGSSTGVPSSASVVCISFFPLFLVSLFVYLM